MKSITIRDVAKEAGVSIATVSRVLSGKDNVSAETRQQIAGAIKRTGYKLPTTADRSLLADDGMIYYIMRSASVNVYSHLLNRQLIQAAHARGLKIITSNIDVEPNEVFPEEEMLANLQMAKRSSIRGLIISGFSEDFMTVPVLQALRELRFPVALVVRAPSDYSFNRVLTGGERGAFQATQHMLEAGRRHLIMVTFHNHSGKRSGFQRAIQEYGRDDVSSQMVEVADDGYESCAAALEKALRSDRKIDGIFCCSDELAAHLCQKLRGMGARVPEDVEVIGYNDNLAPFLCPPLSSVHVPLKQIAETALELIFEQELGRTGNICKSVMLDPQLILR